jgi:hypothetical protein
MGGLVVVNASKRSVPGSINVSFLRKEFQKGKETKGEMQGFFGRHLPELGLCEAKIYVAIALSAGYITRCTAEFMPNLIEPLKYSFLDFTASEIFEHLNELRNICA